MVRYKSFNDELIDAVLIDERLPQIHEVELVAHGMEKFANPHGIFFKERFEHVGVNLLNNPTRAEPVFLKFHKKDDLLIFPIHGECRLKFRKPVAPVEIQNAFFGSIEYVFYKL